ncbi:Glucosidase 2 subunit beta [Pseudolycoriella hygida]|uniref:Glucosidase 2 subunit beta n=1 Tax=Pseudolycoriella hygida TaxID=35572 RepID=A0A9Q0MVB7_9DIPT|nr:Glucosidase 2 subunit beta [Pseudolycoriella hygida]
MEHLQHIFLTFALISCFGLSVLSEIPRPRGVPLSKANLYSPGDTFACLDGKKVIKFNQVNDDYCDCYDSSDEPGTSACPQGQFHCTNAGHKPKNIPSSQVNDGVCDCCDASDEYQSQGKCVNICSELGKEERQREKELAELAKLGYQLRTEMASKGRALKDQKLTRQAELRKHQAEAEILKNERLQIKDEVESLEKAALDIYKELQEREDREKRELEQAENDKEAENTFMKYDSNGNQLVEIEEIQTRIAFDKNRDGEVCAEEAKYFLDDHEAVNFETFKTLCWPKIKPYLMLDSGLFKPPADVELVDRESTTNAPIEYDPETKKLIEQANGARNLFLEAERELREIETEIAKLDNFLVIDFGTNDEFIPLHGECFNYEDREYVYKICPFDKAIQQPRSGGAETRLGTYEEWDKSPNKYSTMVFSNGASCWNGPQRSATVHLECGLETKLTSVTEPNRCEYVCTMQTPAVCNINSTGDTSEYEHDEL